MSDQEAPRYLMRQRDRQGRWIWYVRRKGRRKVRLPCGPWSIGFEAAYLEALDKINAEHPDIAIRRRTRPVLERRPSPQPGYVYFLRLPSGIKIGFSTNPWSRILSLKGAFAEPILSVVAAHGNDRDEKKLHEKFATYRKAGEWFRPSRAIKDAMARVAAYGGIEHAFDTDELK